MRILALAVVLAACGGGVAIETSTTTSADAMRTLAFEFAESAQRALDDSIFEIPVDALADLVVDACQDIRPTERPRDTALRAAAGVSRFGDDPVEDAVLVDLLAVGIRETCPDRVEAAATSREAFLSLVAEGANATEIDVESAVSLRAGRAMCDALDEGGGLDDAFDAAAVSIFGQTVDALEASGAGEDEGVVIGVVVAAAASFICPQHLDTVQG